MPLFLCFGLSFGLGGCLGLVLGDNSLAELLVESIDFLEQFLAETGEIKLLVTLDFIAGFVFKVVVEINGLFEQSHYLFSSFVGVSLNEIIAILYEFADEKFNVFLKISKVHNFRYRLVVCAKITIIFEKTESVGIFVRITLNRITV